MLKCHLEEETNTCKIEAKGNLIGILTDATFLIHEVYITFQNKSPIMGDLFRCMLRDVVNDDSSPIWKVSGTRKAVNDGVKGVSVHIPGELRNMLDTLREDEHGE